MVPNVTEQGNVDIKMPDNYLNKPSNELRRDILPCIRCNDKDNFAVADRREPSAALSGSSRVSRRAKV